MEDVCWPYFDPEYENLSFRINPPRVVIDNETDSHYTLVKVDSVNRHATLLEVVQVLTDLDLNISKAYVSSDGGWLMDVFYATNQLGNKITDERLKEFIQQSLVAKQSAAKTEVATCFGRVVGQSIAEQTAIELIGTDRPGLLSEIAAVLAHLKCNVVAAEVWTHNARAACVVYVTDEETGAPIEEVKRLADIKEQLYNVMRGNDDRNGVRLEFSMGLTHTERRLHQIMSADRDYEISDNSDKETHTTERPTSITIENCREKGYSVVTIGCKDRPKLLFDIVCTLTDMQYVVFHASIHADGINAVQEYYIRHVDGCTLDSEGERQRAIQCLEAAIERRVSEGLRLEVCSKDRVGLLSEITRVFRESGLTVTRADVSTQEDKAINVFYVSNAFGGPVDMKAVEAVRQKIGQTMLQVRGISNNLKPYYQQPVDKSVPAFMSLLKTQWERFSTNWGLISS